MKLGCCAYSYRKLLQSGRMDLEGFLDTCAGLGLDGVELTQYYFAREDDDYLHRIKRGAFRRGLAVCGAAVGGNFSQPDAEGRRRQIEHVKDWVAKAAKLGAPVLRVFAGACPQGVQRHTAEGWVRQGLAECAEVADRWGVVLGLETHGGLTADADGVLALLEPFAGHPWVGLNLDFGNLTGDIYAQYERLARRAVTTHVKPAVRRGEGRESVDYRRVVRIMRTAGYGGYLNIEYEENEDARTGVDRFAAYLRGCLEDA
jgi:sugar phosphate isomerase/epimerase